MPDAPAPARHAPSERPPQRKTTNSPPRIAGVAFDCDGLMFNTEEAFYEAGVRLLARRGLELSREIHQLMMGRRAEEAFHALIDALDLVETRCELQREYEAIFRAESVKILNTMPGLLPLIEQIKSRAIPMAVCTSSERDHVTALLTRFQLDDHFNTILSAEDVSRGKPDPEIYLAAARRLGIDPSEMLVLEDSGNGTRAAAAAGAIAVSVPHRHSREHDLSAADLVLESLADERLRALIDAAASPAGGSDG